MSLFHSKKPDGREPDSIWAQRTSEALANRLRGCIVPGARVNNTTQGIQIIPEAQTTTGFSPLKSYALRDVLANYLVVRRFYGLDETGDPILGETDICIAKEYLHRESTDAETILGEDHTYTFADGPSETWDVGTKTSFNRTRTDNLTSEEQRIVPPWRENEIIWAIPGDTGVETEGDSPRNITLLIAGRSCQWAVIST